MKIKAILVYLKSDDSIEEENGYEQYVLPPFAHSSFCFFSSDNTLTCLTWLFH